VLIHGTVILDTDLDAMDRVLRSKVSQKPSERVTTIVREAGTNIDMSRLKAEVVKSLGSALSVDFEKVEMTPFEREAVKKFVADRYGRDSWNSKF
jgi:lipoate-protein ligase A